MKDFIHIGIIDDGVNYVNFNIKELFYDVEITPSLEIKNRDDIKVNISHGTICAAIIKNYLPEVILSSIKILDSSTKGTIEQLVLAIKWCIEKKIKIINMSLGSICCKDYESIKSIIDYAYKKGTIIIAASNNKDYITYPSVLSNVIGVKADRTGMVKEGEYFYNILPKDGVEISGFSNFVLTNNNSEMVIDTANSFASPYITVLVYNKVKSNSDVTIDDIKENLFMNSKNYKFCSVREKLFYKFYSNIDWAENVFLITLSEEIKNDKLVEDIKKECFFNIIDSVGILCHKNTNYLINLNECLNRSTLNKSHFDTVIIYDDLKNEKCIDINYFLNYILSLHKNIIFLSKYTKHVDLKLLALTDKIRIYYSPLVYKMNVLRGNYQKPKIEIPIISIFDFTYDGFYLKIMSGLKKIFRTNGYYWVGVSDNPLCTLIDIEYADFFYKNKMVNKINRTINNILNIYPADILNVGINVSFDQIELLKLMMDSIDLDVVLIITDKYAEYLESMIKNNLNTQFIIIDMVNCLYNLKNANVKIFIFNKENIIEDIFGYIIYLFNQQRDAFEDYPLVNKVIKLLN